MQTYLTEHLVNKSIASPSLLLKKRKNDWKGKPTSWPDIRKNAQDRHIYLLVDSRYPVGFVATATGGYSVKIDGQHYGNYNSSAQFSIADWENYTSTTGYSINEPTGSIKAHIIDVSPQTENENISAFKHRRVDSNNSSEEQGTLWIHFNLTNEINLAEMCSFYPYNYKVNLLTAVTAKNNVINFKPNTAATGSFRADNLEYIPNIKNIQIGSVAFMNTKLKNITLINPNIYNTSTYAFNGCKNLKKLKLNNSSTSSLSNLTRFIYDTMLEKFPDIDWNNVVSAYQMWKDYDRASNNGKPVIIDASAATGLKDIGLFDTKTLVGLRVSNQAPFNSSSYPQIDVHNTALNREAIVTLFNDLPTVTTGQIINITGTTGAADLTDNDKAVATDKGWTIME